MKTPKNRFSPRKSIARTSKVLPIANAGIFKYLLAVAFLAHISKSYELMSYDLNQWHAKSICVNGQEIQLHDYKATDDSGQTITDTTSLSIDTSQECESICRQHITDWSKDNCCNYRRDG